MQKIDHPCHNTTCPHLGEALKMMVTHGPSWSINSVERRRLRIINMSLFAGFMYIRGNMKLSQDLTRIAVGNNFRGNAIAGLLQQSSLIWIFNFGSAETIQLRTMTRTDASSKCSSAPFRKRSLVPPKPQFSTARIPWLCGPEQRNLRVPCINVFVCF